MAIDMERLFDQFNKLIAEIPTGAVIETYTGMDRMETRNTVASLFNYYGPRSMPDMEAVLHVLALGAFLGASHKQGVH